MVPTLALELGPWLEDLGLQVVGPRFLILYAYVACVCYVHFRGKARLRFARQFTEHSGLLSPYNVLMYAFSAVPRTPFLAVDSFPEMGILRDNWKTIRDEALGLHEGGHIRGLDKNNDMAFLAFRRRGWKRFYLKWYDDFLPSARALCPKTVELVKSIPQINAAAYTLLPPGGTLGRHRDPLAGSLRYHLGLVIPASGKCRIWVDGEEYNWREGEDVVFDETYVHWAENTSDEARIIFFADIARPLRTRFMRAFSRFMVRRVFCMTSSNNEAGEQLGALNRATPVVYGIKQKLLDFKKQHRGVYYTLKRGLILALVYMLFLRPWIASWLG